MVTQMTILRQPCKMAKAIIQSTVTYKATTVDSMTQERINTHVTEKENPNKDTSDNGIWTNG
jgi:hypothetical protein